MGVRKNAFLYYLCPKKIERECYGYNREKIA